MREFNARRPPRPYKTRPKPPKTTDDGLLVGSDEWAAQMLEKMRR